MVSKRFSSWLLTGLTALACGSVTSQVLYDQTFACEADRGSALSARLLRSTNVESADDFIVPAGKIWRPDHFTFRGNRNIAGDEVQITIYPDNEQIFCLIGVPCPDSVPAINPLCTATGQASQFGDDVSITLDPNFCTLEEGRYWLSVVLLDNNCGQLFPCQNWYWREAFVFTPVGVEDREWVIRDIGNTSAEVTCGGFGLASSCQSQSVQSGLCFNIQGEEEDQQAPFSNREMISETVLVGNPVNINVSAFFDDNNGQALTFSAPNLPPYLNLSSAGVISGSPTAGNAGEDPAFVVRATDTTDLFAELVVALRVVNPATISLGNMLGSDERLRCTSDKAVDFSLPGSCGNASGVACDPMPVDAIVTNAQVLVDLNHPEVSDLTLTIQNPGDTNVTLMRRPIFAEDATPPAGVCPDADIKAIFTDSSPWPVERRCASPLAIAGSVEPEQPLAEFRNQPGAGVWQLGLENAGRQTALINQWCVALQFESSGQPIYPQAERPGSATLVDLGSQNEVTVTRALNGPRDVAWFLIDQGQEGHQAVDTRITPAQGQVLQSHRWGNEKFPGLDPNMAVGDCSDSRELIYPQFIPAFGRELLRVSSCGDNWTGSFELTISKDVLGPTSINVPVLTGVVEGDTVDAVTGDPVPLAYLTSFGTSAFSNPDGNFAAAMLAGPNQVTVFHPNYLAETFEVEVEQGEIVAAGTVELTPTSFPGATNQIVFGDGFE